jgi:hypothetical protein
LGVCEAIGEDFGFNPTFLRVPLAGAVLYSIPLAIAAYFALGAIVLASRLLFPKPKAVAPAAVSTADETSEPIEYAKAA